MSRAVSRVLLDHPSGQTTLDADDELSGPAGPVALEDVAEVLSDPQGWIEYDTTLGWSRNEEPEPWQEQIEPPADIEDRPCRVRIYARFVTQVFTIFEEVAVP